MTAERRNRPGRTGAETSTTPIASHDDTRPAVDPAIAEPERLALCEDIIARGLRTFIEVGEALLAIRDSRLYRHTHDTFDGYCRDRWGWTASRARQLIGAAQTATNVTVHGAPAPATESQARALNGLTAHQAAIVMRVAEARTGGNVTAAAIEAARRQPWTDAEVTEQIDGYRIHWALAVVPALSESEWEGLAESVGRIGLIRRIDISVDGGTLVDGRFRYMALRWHGIDPGTATTLSDEPVLHRVDGSEDAVIDRIIGDNLGFRKCHTADQIAAGTAAIWAAEAVTW